MHDKTKSQRTETRFQLNQVIQIVIAFAYDDRDLLLSFSIASRGAVAPLSRAQILFNQLEETCLQS